VVIPVHLNVVSITPLLAGVVVLAYNKSFADKFRRLYGRRWKEYLDGYFLSAHKLFRKWGVYRFAVVFFGLWLLLNFIRPAYIGEPAWEMQHYGRLLQ